MLHLALGLLVYLVSGQSNPTLNTRGFYLIDMCVNTSSSWVNPSSTICHCSDRSVHCNFYSDDNCTDYSSQSIRGGCGGTIYGADRCTRAQDFVADLGDDCGYWVTSGGTVYPLNQCRDSGCGSGYLSCIDAYDSGDVQRGFYNNYDCSGIADTSTTYTTGRLVNQGDGSTNCGVVSTGYSVNSNVCGSKNSPFDTSKSSSACKYLQTSNGGSPIAIDQCFESRSGYYSYSSRYECNTEGTAVSLFHYLDSSSCSGTGYKVRTYSNMNASVHCDGSACGGTYGLYDSCNNYNWDADYYETPVAFGRCIPVYDDPDTGSDGFKTYEQPWYWNMSMVYTCNSVGETGGGAYPSVYYYPFDSDCKGDYVFDFDYLGYVFESASYKGLKCAYPKVSGCSQGTKVKEDDIPGLSVCSNAFRHLPQFAAVIVGLVALVL